MKKKCYEMMDGMENAMNVLMIAKRQTKVHQIYGMMYEDGTRTQVFNWSERACHLSYCFFFSRYYGKILIMERIVYFYTIEICLMGKGKF